jgi:MFS family permease
LSGTTMSQPAIEARKLLTFEFIGLCLIVLLLTDYLSVFYNLFNYLETLGIPADLRGLVVGSFSISAMLLYLVASPFLNLANASRTVALGIGLLIASGLAYFFIESFWGLLTLRLINGAGQFCVTAGAMTLFVWIIPRERSGQAFALYSVAMLFSYAVGPAAMETLEPFIPTPAYAYAITTVLLMPAAWIVWSISSRHSEALVADVTQGHLPAWGDIRANLAQRPLLLLLLMNMIHSANWMGLFFLFKGFALEHGLVNVGTFFMMQMMSMIVIRLIAGRLFDLVDKERLIQISFLIVAAGYLALDYIPGAWAVPLLGLGFGLGMGFGFPALSGLMFDVSDQRFRSVNSNLTLFSMQSGFFFGPVVGGALVAYRGYHGYFLASSALALVAATLGQVLGRQKLKEG